MAVFEKSGYSTVPNSVTVDSIYVSLTTNAAIAGFSETSEEEDGTAATSNLVMSPLYDVDYEDPTPGALTTAVSDVMETAYIRAASHLNFSQ